MNRAGFFKAIGGAIAATVGVKYVPPFLSYTANAPPCRPMMLADIVKARKIIGREMSPELKKAIEIEISHINSVAKSFIKDSDKMLVDTIPENLGEI